MDSLIVFCAKDLVIGVALLWVIAWWQQSPSDKKRMFITSAIAGIIAVVSAQIASKLYYDPRPFTHGTVKALFDHGADNGFPSDHSWFAMTLSALIYMYNRQLGYGALILTVIIGWARVAAHVHSPIDIVGGFAIGILAAYIARSVYPLIFKNQK